MPDYEFARPALSVDAVVFTDEPTRILLVRRAREPFAGRWALPGGFVDEMEPLEDAVRRELREETGLTDIEGLRQVKTYGAPGRDPRGWTVSIAFSAAVTDEVAVEGADDAEEAAWFPIEDIPELAFDHDEIVRDASWLHRHARR